MDRHFSALLCILFFILTDICAQPISVAVNELTGTGFTSNELAVLSQRLRSELIKTGSFSVMERAEMSSILTEQGFQQSGACDESSCYVEVGRLLGVQQIIAGTVGKVGENFFTISLRMIDVSSGKIMKSADYDFTGELHVLVSTGLKKSAELLAGNSDYGLSSNAGILTTINTIPAQVSLKLNDSLIGTTPYQGTLSPGNYRLTLSKEGFKTGTENLTVQSGSKCSVLYTLDTLQFHPQRKGRAVRIISSVIGVSALSLGKYCDSRMKSYNTKAVELESKAKIEQNGIAYNADFLSAVSNRDRMKSARTILYSLSGVTVPLFSISFAFGKES